MIRALTISILLLGVIVWQRGSVSIAHRAADQVASSRDAMEAERDAARAEADAAAETLKAERSSAAAANALASKYEKEKNDAQTASDRPMTSTASCYPCIAVCAITWMSSCACSAGPWFRGRCSNGRRWSGRRR